MFPARSATAMTIGTFSDLAASSTTCCTSAAVSGTGGGGGGELEAGVLLPHETISVANSGRSRTPKTTSADRPQWQWLIPPQILAGGTHSAARSLKNSCLGGMLIRHPGGNEGVVTFV